MKLESLQDYRACFPTKNARAPELVYIGIIFGIYLDYIGVILGYWKRKWKLLGVLAVKDISVSQRYTSGAFKREQSWQSCLR